VEPEDLLRFGLIPEFVGRLPVISTLHSLDEKALLNILTEPKNALVKQYKKLFRLDGVELEFERPALQAIVQKAILRGTGARALRSIMEDTMLDTMFHLPQRQDVTKCVITKETIARKKSPTFHTKERRATG